MGELEADARKRMVEEQLVKRHITDERVLAAMREIPRHLFVPEEMRHFAYTDQPLPIGKGQTISQPLIVAFMIQCAGVTSADTVLEIGTGSGYAAAVLSKIVKQVYTIERLPDLLEQAKERFTALHLSNIEAKAADGSLGWPDHSPYDAIIVTAGAPIVPHSLRDQLAVGGRLIIPIGNHRFQQLVRVTRDSETNFSSEVLETVRFVPLIGKEGWSS